MLRIGSLCTGYGGLDMAVEAYFEAETIWTCEFDKHASKIIQERINKPNYGNLKTMDWHEAEPIDILTAGYPCQPFSHAGSRKGVEDERHLWPYIKEIIGILRPRFVVLENVRGHFGLGFPEVLADLALIGYDARWRLIRASDVGAPHRRERLFILAYPISARWDRAESGSISQNKPRFTGENTNDITTDTYSYAREKSRETSGEIPPESVGLRRRSNERKTGAKSRSSFKTVSNTDNGRRIGSMPRLQKRYDPCSPMHLQEVPAALDKGRLNVKFVEYMMGLPDGWVSDIDISRAHKLKILGNGVVPQQAYRALEMLCITPYDLRLC